MDVTQPAQPAPVPPPTTSVRPRNGLGVAALVIGVASLVAGISFILFPLALIGGLVGLILGIVALTRGKNRGATSLNVEDVDDLLERVEALGGRALCQPDDMPWGQPVAHVEDPDSKADNLTQPDLARS